MAKRKLTREEAADLRRMEALGRGGMRAYYFEAAMQMLPHVALIVAGYLILFWGRPLEAIGYTVGVFAGLWALFRAIDWLAELLMRRRTPPPL